MSAETIVRLARTVAVSRGLLPDIILALIEQESAFDPWATRYEPAFYDKYVSPLVANADMSKTEARLRAFSFGLMQVMGQTAREAGYSEPLPKLFEPEVNLNVGCTVLLDKLKLVNFDLRLALLRWNGGGRPAYADEVMARMDRWA
jgi:soluble lytic murein transglycosylase-like protein